MSFVPDQKVKLVLSYGHDYEYSGIVAEADSDRVTIWVKKIRHRDEELLTFVPSTYDKDHYKCIEEGLYYDIYDKEEDDVAIKKLTE